MEELERTLQFITDAVQWIILLYLILSVRTLYVKHEKLEAKKKGDE